MLDLLKQALICSENLRASALADGAAYDTEARRKVSRLVRDLARLASWSEAAIGADRLADDFERGSPYPAGWVLVNLAAAIEWLIRAVNERDEQSQGLTVSWRGSA